MPSTKSGIAKLREILEAAKKARGEGSVRTFLTASIETTLKEAIEEFEGIRGRLNAFAGPNWDLFVGRCGHTWKKEESDDCPLCARDLLKEKLETATQKVRELEERIETLESSGYERGEGKG